MSRTASAPAKPRSERKESRRQPAARAVLTEGELLDCAVRRLHHGGQLPALMCCEVPVLGRSVDLAMAVDGLLFTFEFKLADWRRAIRQAHDHRLVADYAFVCMPPRPISPELRTLLDEAGVGMVVCDPAGSEPFEVVVPAPRSTEVSSTLRKRVLAYMTDEGTRTRVDGLPLSVEVS